MTGHLVMLLAAVVLAAVGGESFVRGAVGLSTWARIPAGLVGVTVAAFATSSPELSVGIQAAGAGRPELALGDALGSNVVNVAIVLGVVLCFGSLCAARTELRRDLATALAAPVITLLALVDGVLTRAEAGLLVVVFVIWLGAVGRQAMRDRSPVQEVLGARARGSAVAATLIGLLLLVLSGRFIVTASKGIGAELGLDSFVVGATFVAIATSTPELATAVIARARGHSEIGVGAVLGSNVFNNLWIVGLVGLIEPITSSVSEIVVAVGACVIALLLVVPRSDERVPASRGPALLAVGASYLVVTVVIGP